MDTVIDFNDGIQVEEKDSKDKLVCNNKFATVFILCVQINPQGEYPHKFADSIYQAICQETEEKPGPKGSLLVLFLHCLRRCRKH